ncbi:imidazole glycerol phosphate synthase cyclase subunit [Leptospira sp. 2 VSF19]|uniref:imidazole glycerol-phosphate synthase n=1 Tax=Leptospira soteropolitanensis TaxID=2950025 RepID=A0AAW5VCX2_9LEPT|nr:imidazole glycerol phosphate synthase cyclase subunit [Leptospira soteropolitanensis]MCW7493156.1 imidazole glycerol phosphate synthase cyclase subunit [Leptospira soteropolitanensis]MCW7500775.1 imidazole glycerol phosphate synthase cyclase subunit [Leptospira soteropolitanensis]MCW7523006.1 imidazole glycerol phosphate synthase cyclase subunit [Leptospira soteropolitanensis]MCW7526887.1 imidazole glycerol phosphate synthase cyclase subunit [Leptospira soteropolitanensis]MCW7530724.1 imida
MLKKRIIAVILVKDGVVVQSIGFRKFLPIGRPEIALEFLTSWGIDEIIYLDISASKENLSPNYDLIRKSARKCYVPLTVGGGIRNTSQVSELMNAGADKVSVNQASLNDIKLISKIASLYGNQCVVASVDVVKTENGYKVYDYINKKSTTESPIDFAKKLSDSGAGEIFLNSVDRDGSYKGYDIELICSISDAVNIPVICCGGAKNGKDIETVFEKSNVSAAAAGNFFHFTEHSVNITKSVVSKKENIRLETYADYIDSKFDSDLRLAKKADRDLEEMLFLRIEKEVI